MDRLPVGLRYQPGDAKCVAAQVVPVTGESALRRACDEQFSTDVRFAMLVHHLESLLPSRHAGASA